MPPRVAVIGVGFTPVRPTSPDVSYRELTFEAAQRAYADAGIAHTDVQSAVCCEEDFFEGISIADEYTPDQLGVVLQSVETVNGDGLHGLAVAAMQIQTGVLDCVVVEAHSKASNILTFDHITHYALDPIWTRPLNVHPEFIAGLEMRAWLHRNGVEAGLCDAVAARNRTAALANPWAAYAARVEAADVAATPERCSPLRDGHAARRADGAVVLVLANEARARKAARPVWIRGTGFCNDTPTLESRDWVTDHATKRAAAIAYREAGITTPRTQIDWFEVDDAYAHRQPMALQALGVIERAADALDPGLPVNRSGGAIGMGHTLDTVGLYRAVACIEAIRAGQAGTALAQAWRGVPTTSVACAVFGSAP